MIVDLKLKKTVFLTVYFNNLDIRPSDSNSEKNNAKASIHVGAVLVNPSDLSLHQH